MKSLTTHCHFFSLLIISFGFWELFLSLSFLFLVSGVILLLLDFHMSTTCIIPSLFPILSFLREYDFTCLRTIMWVNLSARVLVSDRSRQFCNWQWGRFHLYNKICVHHCDTTPPLHLYIKFHPSKYSTFKLGVNKRMDMLKHKYIFKILCRLLTGFTLVSTTSFKSCLGSNFTTAYLFNFNFEK